MLWSASWLDTLPQCILIVLLAGEERLHLAFVLAAFLANFPQALASASLLMEYKAAPLKVLLAWSSIWLVSAGCAFLIGWVTPVDVAEGGSGTGKQIFAGIVAGLSGGAMIAYVSATMLPAAFERSQRNATLSGLLCTIGFVAALTMEVFAGPMAADELWAPTPHLSLDSSPDGLRRLGAVCAGGTALRRGRHGCGCGATPCRASDCIVYKHVLALSKQMRGQAPPRQHTQR